MNADQLRTTLQVLAHEAATAPSDLAEAVLSQRRTLRLRRAAMTGAAAAVAVVVAGVPVAVQSHDHRDAQVAAPATPLVDIYDRPTRGSLAEDSAFLDEVRQLPWTDPGFESDPLNPAPAEDARQVVFAGDVPNARWVLIVGPAQINETTTNDSDGDTLQAAWFIGPVGAQPDELQRYRQAPGIDSDRPTALLDSSTGALVVIAAPGDRIEVSPHPQIDAAGAISRSYEPAADTDGVAVIALGPAELIDNPAVTYRVLRDGATIVATSPVGHGNPAALADPVFTVSDARGAAPTALSRQAVNSLALRIVEHAGLRSEQLDLTNQWAGEIPGLDNGSTGASIMTATLPSGAVLLEAGAFQTGPDGGGLAFDCAREVQPAGRPAETRTFAVVCTIGDNNGRMTQILIALGGSTATAVDIAGEISPLGPEGVLVTPVPAGLERLRFLDAAGSVTDETTVSGLTADFGP